MKCPKCGYLGFEEVERCRNCGYDFSLSAPLALPELPLRPKPNTPHPLDDLEMLDAALPAPANPPLSDVGPDLDRLIGVPPPRADSATKDDLPLFVSSIAVDDEPLIRKPSPPRPPLAVRRSTPDVPRLRAESPSRTASLDLRLDEELDGPPEHESANQPIPFPMTRIPGRETRLEEGSDDAPVGARLAAVSIDLLILAAIDAVVVYFTMQICGITLQEFSIVPKGPLLVFLCVQNGGYLVAFTAGGQTLGKMVAGIRVVSAESDADLDLGRALLRTAMWVVLAVPVGLGFVSALFNREHRGLHDRFAGTRVVR